MQMKTLIIILIVVVILVAVVLVFKAKGATSESGGNNSGANSDAPAVQPDAYKPDMAGPPIDANAGKALGLLPNVLPNVRNTACMLKCATRYPFDQAKKRACQAAC